MKEVLVGSRELTRPRPEQRRGSAFPLCSRLERFLWNRKRRTGFPVGWSPLFLSRDEEGRPPTRRLGNDQMKPVS